MRERLETQGTIKSYYYYIDPDLQYVQVEAKNFNVHCYLFDTLYSHQNAFVRNL